MGHSEGALVGLLTAQRGGVAAYVSVADMADSFGVALHVPALVVGDDPARPQASYGDLAMPLHPRPARALVDLLRKQPPAGAGRD